MQTEEALDRLGATLTGLPEKEVKARLDRLGPNRLPGPRRRSVGLRLLAQFHNVLIYVLLAATVVSAWLGQTVDAAVILGVVVINAAIGFVQEGRAEHAVEAIRSMLTPTASVLRSGYRTTVAATGVVPGDLVLLEPGDQVPADLRLVIARNLTIEEALLTGESAPVDKGTTPASETAALADRSSMAYSGTTVAAGSGTGVVVATGDMTEIGRIGRLLTAVEPLTTPLLRQMNRFSRRLMIGILLLATAVFVVARFVRGYAMGDAFMAVVGMAVAAIPESLPAVLTITLAIGVRHMALRHALVRRLPAVETLGSVSVICSDKTGTLTRNEMCVRVAATAEATFEIAGTGYRPEGEIGVAGNAVAPSDQPVLVELARAAYLCNNAQLRPVANAWEADGDPMEAALLAFARKAGIDPDEMDRHAVRLDEIPFDRSRRMMATLHGQPGGRRFMCVKGAPEHVFDICASARGADGDLALQRRFWHDTVERLAADGQRIIAVATKAAPGERGLEARDLDATDFTLLGVLALIDPPRDEAIAAVRDCTTAGIRVKMITGDHGSTASAVARRLGLANPGRIVTGDELERLDDAKLEQVVHECDVFARTTAEHKLRLVEALQRDGGVVAMTGDGINDAPALKRADVGVAMGRRGTEAARQAAEIVLADDNFASIVAAVHEGRTVYDNLKKVIAWTLPTNGGEALIIAAAILFGMTLPLTPVQILWVNMTTAVALGLTLVFEPAEPDAMQRAPRPPAEPLLSGFLAWRIAFVSGLFVLGGFGLFAWTESRGREIEAARTLVVNAVVAMEVAYLFSVRYLKGTSFSMPAIMGTRAVWIGVCSVVLLQLAFTYLPWMQRWFGTRALTPIELLAIAAVAVCLLLILELEKLARRRVAWEWRAFARHARTRSSA